MIVGYAKWNFYERQRLEADWGKTEEVDWCEGRAKQLAEVFLGATYNMRQKIWEGRPHCCEQVLSASSSLPEMVELRNFALYSMCSTMRSSRATKARRG